MKKYQTSEWAYRAIKGVFKSILRITYDVRIHDAGNLEGLSSDQGFIMASNHGSIVDAFVMGLMIDTHRVRFVGRQKSLWSNPIFGKINDIVGTIPVPERTVKNKSVVVETCVNALKQGACIGIFPEGAILPRRKAYNGKTGMARMVLEAGIPVAPIGLFGTGGLWPYGAKMPRLGKPVEMVIGEPMYFDEYHGMHENKEVVKYVTDLVMKEIRSLSSWHDVPNQDVVELYNYYKDLKKPVI
ncbi:MAG: 1-acyl-sn-glycerol-3-phosphate acyltransferase [Candidatus Heimdallarchaeota archaeon LC_2]|nr:MAG: 1-acyl-sn-glycerol-3-phosphate acyltransferase [Candidatus Heimdallarchaeota archaeon LC_2]